jgi:uncharacterized protein
MADDPAATALGVLALAQADDFDRIRDLFAPQLQSMVSADGLRAVWAAELTARGAVTGVGTPLVEAAGPAGGGVTVVKVPVIFERGERTLLVGVAPGGRLGGLQIAGSEAAAPVTPWEAPAYADPGSFSEHEVLGGNGTLSVPHGDGPWPAVVMLAGSGPNDRDGTLGRNKPLKDVAWGLASRGVAVLRFDKVTYGRRAELARHAEFTMTDEYVPDAIEAIEEVRGRGLGPVFVLGHSMGGTAAPRVAAADPDVAGLILLAGGAEPLHRAALRQVRYLAEATPGMQAAVDGLAAQVARVDSPDLSPGIPAGELPFGVPAPYWLDLRDYDPAALAATLDRPVLLLQGGRDYQVTVTDDLARWQAALKPEQERHHTTVHIYPADNHAFFAGTGRSGPNDYEATQHVDPQVVTDIAAWITRANGPAPRTRPATPRADPS